MVEHYIGLMSGTSLDAIDVALVKIDDKEIQTVASLNYPLPDHIRTSILTLINPQTDNIQLLGEIDHQLGYLFAEAVLALLEKTHMQAAQIRAIGSHGQTIRHAPDIKTPFTLQIGDPHIIAYRTGITTVADFRRKDMAAGGQGAPLAPFFHAQIFKLTSPKVILNIGGMANITYLSEERIFGFDTGPGNVLLDAWIYKHQSKKFDDEGKWAAGGKLNTVLLDKFLREPYFSKQPPKSTGRELFHLSWLEKQLTDFQALSPQDVQQTLLHLTAESIVNAIKNHVPKKITEIIVCGGGTHNKAMLALIEKNSNIRAVSSAQYKIDPDFMEATAFAWFAKQTLTGQPGNLTAVTGAEKPVVLGAIILA